MKSVIVLALALSASGAFAAAVDAGSLGCQDARTLLRHAGPSGKDFSSGGVTKRYWSDAFGSQYADCSGKQHADTGWVVDADGGNCPLGNVCVDGTGNN
jgi:hypothetical protein